MTTERQKQANRANAQKSSGPRCRAGRARSARNALRHGLTTSPDWSNVTSWYRIILDDPGIEPDLLDIDPMRQAALNLAEAEAWRDRATRVEQAHIADMANRALTQGQWRPLENGDLDLDDPETLRLMIRNYTDDFIVGALRIMLRASPKRPVALRKTQKQLTRYRREAEARRRKALKIWIALNSNVKNSETNPNTT
jgi:hypothetical protein